MTDINHINTRDYSSIAYDRDQLQSNVRNWINYTYGDPNFILTNTHSFCDSLLIPRDSGDYFTVANAAYMKDLATYKMATNYHSISAFSTISKKLLYVDIVYQGSVKNNQLFFITTVIGSNDGIPPPLEFDDILYYHFGGDRFPTPNWDDYTNSSNDLLYPNTISYAVEKAVNNKFGLPYLGANEYIDTITYVGFKEFDNEYFDFPKTYPPFNPDPYTICGPELARCNWPSIHYIASYDSVRNSFLATTGPRDLNGLGYQINTHRPSVTYWYNKGVEFFTAQRPLNGMFLNCELFLYDYQDGSGDHNFSSNNAGISFNNYMKSQLPNSTQTCTYQNEQYKDMAVFKAPVTGVPFPYVKIYGEERDFRRGLQRSVYYASYGVKKVRGQ